MKNAPLAYSMSIKDAFSMHAARENPFEEAAELIKGVTVRLPVETRAHLAALSQMLDMSRQEVLEEVVTGGLSEAFAGYLEHFKEEGEARSQEVKKFHALAEQFEQEMRAEEEGK